MTCCRFCQTLYHGLSDITMSDRCIESVMDALFVEYFQLVKVYACIMRRFFDKLVKRKSKCADITATIRNLKSPLSSIIEPDFGLLDQLLSLDVLSRRQLARVRSQTTVYERNDAVLDLLETEDQCYKFLKALQLTHQQHVVNLIVANGGQTIKLSVNYPTVVGVKLNAY